MLFTVYFSRKSEQWERMGRKLQQSSGSYKNKLRGNITNIKQSNGDEKLCQLTCGLELQE